MDLDKHLSTFIPKTIVFFLGSTRSTIWRWITTGFRKLKRAQMTYAISPLVRGALGEEAKPTSHTGSCSEAKCSSSLLRIFLHYSSKKERNSRHLTCFISKKKKVHEFWLVPVAAWLDTGLDGSIGRTYSTLSYLNHAGWFADSSRKKTAKKCVQYSTWRSSCHHPRLESRRQEANKCETNRRVCVDGLSSPRKKNPRRIRLWRPQLMRAARLALRLGWSKAEQEKRSTNRDAERAEPERVAAWRAEAAGS